MSRTFARNSRYYGAASKRYVAPDGREIDYIAGRTIPPPQRFAPLALHRLDEAARIDLLSNRYYGDPEQYWRICDANLVFWPPTATDQPGGVLVIPLPLEVQDRGDS